MRLDAGRRGLIFDVDGTLVDSNDAHAAAWAEALGEFEIERDVETIKPLIGMGSDKLLPRAAGVSADSELGQRILSRRMELFGAEHFADVKPFPCTRELFMRLRDDGVRLAIASSAKKDELDPLLELAGVRDLLDADAVASSDDVAASKPDPDAVEAALARLRTDPGATLMIGDSPYDIEAALRARVGVIALRCGGWEDRDLSDAMAIYDDPKDLLLGYMANAWSFPPAIGKPAAQPRPNRSSLR